MKREQEEEDNSLDSATPRYNGEILRIQSASCPGYDIEGGWLREFNRACDRFLLSRGIDPREGQWESGDDFTTEQKGVDKSHTF